MPEPKLYSLADAAKILSENAPPPAPSSHMPRIVVVNKRIAELEAALGQKPGPKTFNVFRGQRRIEFLESELAQKNAGTLAPAPVALAPVAVAPVAVAPSAEISAVAAAPAPVATAAPFGRGRCQGVNTTGFVNLAKEDAALRVDRPPPASNTGRARFAKAFDTQKTTTGIINP